MASDQGGKDITMIAGADLSSKQYLFMAPPATDGKIDPAGAGVDTVGILQNDPAAEGRAATVRISGTSKCVAGATITPDDKLASDSNGKAAVAGSADHVVAHALEGADSGDVFEVLLISNHLNV